MRDNFTHDVNFINNYPHRCCRVKGGRQWPRARASAMITRHEFSFKFNSLATMKHSMFIVIAGANYRAYC